MANEEIKQSQQGQEGNTLTCTCGCSNTPPTWSEPRQITEGGFPRFNCCIDYLKVTFPGDFFPEKGLIKEYLPLLRAYKIDIQDARRRGGLNGYKRGYEFDEHVLICAGGEYTKKRSTDEETFNIELRGEGCREFENKVRAENADKTPQEIDKAVLEAWRQLFEVILEFRGKCTRIDLPTDDFAGFVPLEELKIKIRTRCYKSRMRKNNKIDPLGEDEEEEDDTVYYDEEGFDINPVGGTEMTSNDGGYTATLGSRTNLQLCIYNKKAEREHNTMGVVNMPSWVRFECRFYKENAEEIFGKLYLALQDENPCSFNKFCVGCLAGMITFKESITKQIRHAKTWAVWEQFIGEVEKVESISQSRIESTIQSNAIWLNEDASKSFARICYCYPELAKDLFYALLRDGIGRFDKKDLAKINNQRMADNLPVFADLTAAGTNFLAMFGAIPEPDARMVKFLSKEIAKLNGTKVVVSVEPIFEEKKPEGDKPEGNE